MAFTLLGNNSVSIEDGWVVYNAITLAAGRTYVLEAQIFSSSPTQLYSYFKIRYAYPTQNSPVAANVESWNIYFEPVRQYLSFKIPDVVAATGNAIFAVRRFGYYKEPGTLAAATVALAMDPLLFS